MRRSILGLAGLLLSAETALAAAAAPPRQSPYFVPPSLWSVRVSGGAHLGHPVLRVDISPEFRWPAVEGTKPVEYRVTVRRPNSRPAADVARITREERFAVISLVPPWLADFLDPFGDVRENRLDREEVQELALFAEAELAEREKLSDIVRRFEEIVRLADDQRAHLTERQAVWKWTVELVPYIGNQRVVLQDNPAKKAEPPKYKWGEKVTDPADPCNGKKPEDCAREKLRKFRDKLCEKKPPNDQPLFPRECEELNRLLGLDPPQPAIPCDIPSESGVIHGATDTVTGKIDLSGEYLLRDDCAVATVIHELTHSFDVADGKYPNLKKYLDAMDKAEKANKEAKEAAEKDPPDLETFKKKSDEAVKAEMEAAGLRQAAAAEKIANECSAFFRPLDHPEFFDYPASNAAWMKEWIKNAINEIAEIAEQFKLKQGQPAMKKEVCDCFSKLFDYILKDKKLLANLMNDVMDPSKNDLIHTDKKLSTVSGLIYLKAYACKGK